MNLQEIRGAYGDLLADSVIAELETFRRVEVDAARDEKRFALGLLGAEITLARPGLRTDSDRRAMTG